VKILRITLAIFVVALAGYALITQNFEFLPYSLFLLAILSFLNGLIELKKDSKEFWGYANLGVAVFLIFIVIYTTGMLTG